MKNTALLKAMVVLAAMVLVAGGGVAQAQDADGEKGVPAAECERESLTTGQPTFTEQVEGMLDEIKQPTPWMTWGADQRLRNIWHKNTYSLNTDGPNNEFHFQRWRTRFWTTISPVENFDFNFRLTWEWRTYCKPNVLRWRDVDDYDVVVDNFNIRLKDLFGTGSALTVGRQDIILGNGWLVLDGTPLDGSRTIYFDAARLTVPLKDIDTTVDLMYIDQQARANKRVEPFNYDNEDVHRYLMEQNERGAILYVTNKSIERTQIDGYFIYKNDTPVLPNGNDADLFTYGMRLTGWFDQDEHWKYYAELAQQLGHKNGHDVCALGFNSRLTYFFKDRMNNQLRAGYEYLSGDKPGTETNEEWDPLWGRWPQFSEIVIRQYVNETRIAQVTNLHRLYCGWTFEPTEKLELCTDYHLLFSDTNNTRAQPQFTEEGVFRGQLLTALLRYKISKHIYGHLLGEVFFPGDYYDDEFNDTEAFLRAEVVFKL